MTSHHHHVTNKRVNNEIVYICQTIKKKQCKREHSREVCMEKRKMTNEMSNKDLLISLGFSTIFDLRGTHTLKRKARKRVENNL